MPQHSRSNTITTSYLYHASELLPLAEVWSSFEMEHVMPEDITELITYVMLGTIIVSAVVLLFSMKIE